ncbi:uncharacterized protein LOC108909997 [Anoplophora glabripennis]|uniref:uncharacterized protein LOC108909997 n=1 Tax=Anoplophora glabripennis TaxID=217634 RepID=UPI0008751B1C|nr:uncharacterized protein LOC108909997 [Anoplophora glabripennis]
MQYIRLNISKNEEIRRSLSMCIFQACRRFFHSNFETVTYSLPLIERDFASATVLNELVLPVLESDQRFALLIKDLKTAQQINHRYIGKSPSYIIQIKKEGELEANIRRLKRFTRWNPHAKFLVVSSTAFSYPLNVAIGVIKSLWNNNVVNAAVLLVDNENNTNFKVYSWKPYSSHSCGTNFSDVLPVGSCSFGVTDSNIDWFRNKIPKNLHGCPVKVKYMVWLPYVMSVKPIAQVPHYDADLGIDVNLLNVIANTLNLSLIYQKSSFDGWGGVGKDYSATKDLKLLKENNVDLVVGGYVNTPHRTVLFDSPQSHIQDSLLFCVPHTPIITGFRNFLNIFKFEVWILVCILYFIVSVCMWYASNFEGGEHLSYRSLPNCLLNNFLISIGLVVSILPKTMRVRCLACMFIIFSLKLNMIYTSYLTSVLSSPNYRQKYESMEEIYKHNLRTYFAPNTKLFFSGNDEKQLHSVPLNVITQRWRNCTNVPKCFNTISSKKDIAVCMPRSYKDYLLNNQARDKRRAIFCLKENVVSFSLTILMRKGFPLFSLFDKGICRIVEGGFINKWMRDIMMNKSERIGSHPEDVEKVQINFDTLVPVFYMLLMGYLGASLALVIELIVQNFNC